MKSNVNLRALPWLLAAGLAFGAAAAQAASGVTITASDETKVALGMTTTEVQQALGRPADKITYRNESGPTWASEVDGSPFGVTEFDIDFGPDGKVVQASERVLGDN